MSSTASVSRDKGFTITLFTDGACKGNPGPGGWGCIIDFFHPALPVPQVIELGGYFPQTTNNEMELIAIVEAFQKITQLLRGFSSHGKILVYSDSQYAIRGISQWCKKWQINQWKTASGKAVMHEHLWKKLIQITGSDLLKQSHIEWIHIPGHQNIAGNEQADKIAVAFSHKKRIQLYDGPAQHYTVALRNI